MYSYVARQPIFNNKMGIVGYELLYRNGTKNSFPSESTLGITQKIFVDQHLTYHTTLLGNKLGFVNFDYDDLINELPLDFPKNKYVIEVLETCEPNKSLFESLTYLKNNGYTIALDDFCISDERWMPFIELADIIKFDIQLNPLNKIKSLISYLKRNNKKLLAEKVENYSEYNEAKSLGFDFYQGYFFAKPELIKNKKPDETFNVNVELLREVNKENFSVEAIEKIISKSTTLTVRLLNYVNSHVSIRSKINSLNQAIAYLGRERIQRFSYHVLISMTAKNKPSILFLNSLYRAYFLKYFAGKLYDKEMADKAFITGMISMIDAILDINMFDYVSELNLDDNITLAILEHQGELGDLLLLVKSLEQGDWDYLDTFQMKYKNIKSKISNDYIDAITNVNNYFA